MQKKIYIFVLAQWDFYYESQQTKTDWNE